MSGRLKAGQKDKIRQFQAWTTAPEKVALFCLSQHDWSVDVACDQYFANTEYYHSYATGSGNNSSHRSSSDRESVDKRKIEALFKRYEDPSERGKITAEGMMRLLNELQLQPDDRSVLCMAYRLQAETQCEFTRDEFVNGMNRLRCDAVDKLRDKLPAITAEICDDQSKFRELYQFTFSFARQPGQKSLELEVALAYWEILLRDRFPRLDLWIRYLQQNHNKPVSKDVWNLLLDFSNNIEAENFNNYDDDGAWPVLIDEFVAWSKPMFAAGVADVDMVEG